VSMFRKSVTYPKYIIGASIISFLGVILIFPCIFETKSPFFLGEVCVGVPVELSAMLLLLWFVLANTVWYILSRG